MQRTKNRIQAEKEAEEGQAMYGNSISKGMRNAKDKIITEASYAPILGLIVGRMSYGGYNPEVEKFMTKNERSNPTAVDREMEKEISDSEMAGFVSSLEGTMANKFKHKKRKFLKPSDD
ncbi:unnamed protein product [Nesidiocoris tenuis]|nr:unnamed protein product [Nesidiocoris tenuis]